MGWRRRTVVLGMAVGLTLGCAACSSGDPGDVDPASTGGATAGPDGSTGPTGTGEQAGPAAACELFTLADAGDLFGAPVEHVGDPVGQGLITASQLPPGSDVCYYRPAPDDGVRFVAVAVVPPGSLTMREYLALTQDATPLGGPGQDGFEVDGGIITRVGDTYVLAIAVTDGNGGNDPSAGLEAASVVVSRLPAPAPDPANIACRLLTEELAEAAAGIDLGFDADEANGQRSGCQYRGRSGPGYVILRVTQGSEAAADFEAERARYEQDVAFRELDGLGDRAFSTDLDVLVLDGETFLWISAFGADGPIIDGGIELAEALVAEA